MNSLTRESITEAIIKASEFDLIEHKTLESLEASIISLHAVMLVLDKDRADKLLQELLDKDMSGRQKVYDAAVNLRKVRLMEELKEMMK